MKGLFVCLLLISICSFFKAEILFIYCDFKRVWGTTFNLEDIPCWIFVPQELITQLLTAEAFQMVNIIISQNFGVFFFCPPSWSGCNLYCMFLFTQCTGSNPERVISMPGDISQVKFTPTTLAWVLH